MVLVALDKAEHQVTDVERPTPYLTVVVTSQRLLILGRSEVGKRRTPGRVGPSRLRGMPLLPVRRMI